jgi:transglutaminase-like putative cysteine protease
MFWVIGTLCIAMFPQVLAMPAHLALITLLPIAWRLAAEIRGWRPVPMLLRVLATALGTAALVFTYGGLMGRRTAVSMLVLMLSLKLLETFRTRDARIVASLSLFLCGTQFLFSQGMQMVPYSVACVLSALIALMYLHRREAYASTGKSPDTGRKLLGEIGYGLRLLALALPIGLVFFLFFPRWGSPLWGIPEEALDARSGLSNSMTPGSIQSLFMDDSPAFRATFEGAPPRHSELYWRGPVFWEFDGQTWQTSYLSRNLLAETKPDPQDAPLVYEIQMEPTERRWVFSLDYPALVPRGTRLTMDYQIIARRPITSLREFTLASDPDFIDSPRLRQTFRRAGLELPEGFNPRTRELINGWRAEANSDTEIVRRALQMFRQQEFRYTLNPPLLTRDTVDEFVFDTRAGFCEHYASAFTVMMRMAGIPARVVTGYQGGYFNDIGSSYMLVRQSDAHAWSEVWLPGTGWSRIDPTAAVAPERVDRSATELFAQRHMFDFEWLRQARNTFDLIQRSWNDWVIAFSADRQSRLFSGLGWDMLDSAKLVLVMLAGAFLVGGVVFLLVPYLLKYGGRRKRDPVLLAWQKFLRKLGRSGYRPAPSMGPMELAAEAMGQLECNHDDMGQIAGLYTQCRYARGGGDADELARLVAEFKPGPARQMK